MPAAGLKHTSNSLLIIIYKAAQRSSPARLFACVSGMTLTKLVQIQPQVFTAKRSERQVVVSNGNDGGSHVARLTSLRTETWYKAKWEWTRLQDKSKSEW